MKSYSKILIIFANILIILASFAFYQNQITGYELSIYDSIFFPIIGLILSILICTVVVLVSINEGSEYDKILGLVTIGFCSLLVIGLPFIKGYVLPILGDSATHIGSILDILIVGHISEHNVYPIVHVWGAVLTLLTNAPLFNISYIIPPFYYITYILSTFILCRSLSSMKVASIASICSMVPLCHYYFDIMPMGSGFMMLPLVLFFLLKQFQNQSLKWSILLLIYMLIIPYWHPFAFFISIYTVILFSISAGIYTFISHERLNNKLIYTSIISIIIFINWAFQNIIARKALSSILLFSDEPPLDVTVVMKASDTVTKLGFNYFDIFIIYIKLYGPLTIFCCFSIIGFFYLLKQFPSRDFKKVIFQDKCTFFLIFLYIVFFSFCIIAAIDSIKPFAIGGQRFLSSVYTLIPLPAALGISLFIPDTKPHLNRMKSYALNRLDKMNMIKLGLLIVTFTFCFSIAIFTLYMSPFIYLQNYAMNVNELSGADWVLNNGDNRYNILYDHKSTNPPRRLSDILGGTVSDYEFSKEEAPGEDEFKHFRYYKFLKLGNSIDINKYLILREKANLLIYTQLYPLLSRYTPADFVRLSNDNSVNLIFSNGEMKTYFVTPI